MIEKNLQVAFDRAIKTFGLANFKSLPMFGSNHSEAEKAGLQKAA